MNQTKLFKAIETCMAQLDIAHGCVAKGKAFDTEKTLMGCRTILAQALKLAGKWCDAEEKVLEKQSEAEGYIIVE